MPKKINYQDELKTLMGVPDSTLRPVTTRVSVACIRKLYQLCDRENLDLSVLVRRILEDQASLYLEKGTARASAEHPPVCSRTGFCTIHLQEETRKLAERVCEGMALDLPTLLQMILAEALPGWILRAGKAQQQRQQALARLENRLSPAKATWNAYCRVAHASHAASLSAVGTLINEGVVELELDTGSVLHLISNLELSSVSENAEDHPGRKALKELIAAGILVPDETGNPPRSTWRLESQALLTKAKNRLADHRPSQRMHRHIDVGP
jgi:hypothetical protein